MGKLNVRLCGEVSLDLPDFFSPAVERTAGGLTTRLLIGGEWKPATGDEVFEDRSPIDGSVVLRAAKASKEDVEAAVAAARQAREGFKGLPASERLEICQRGADVLGEHFDSFVAAIVADLGKTPEQATTEVKTTGERLGLVREEVRKIFGEYIPGDWMAESAGKSAVVLREPVGTVGAFGPFNYPLFLVASKIIPALAAGNTVVAKAPSEAPLALVLFARVLEEAGLAPGVLNVITGPGGVIGETLASHPDVSMISFTGSSSVGRSIAAGAGPKPMHLELGGNAAAIILADADLELAVEKSVLGAFKNAGQRCDAVSRVLVEESVYETYLQRALKEVEQWPVGDPRAEDTKVGPMVNDKAAARVNQLVEDAVTKGARLLAGGDVSDAYHQPTVLADVPLDADIFWEETFGPVLTVVPVADLDTALELANRSRYGLDSAVFTSDLEAAWRAARALECGQVTINDAPAHGVGHFPFGGRKPDSGIGREGLGYSIDECTVLKTVVVPG
ncbi:MAG TPA: aldehyde dehydrogenase family protein [Acidimicrobiales bacterium]|nr:aldehyde dehydrogenase family protein [Acidimicrobiales bacterium]